MKRTGRAVWAGGGVALASLLLGAAAPPFHFEDAAARSGIRFVLRNGASGRRYQVETMVAGLGVIDYDNDGWPDLYVVNGAALPSLEKKDGRYFNRLYHNNHDGTFTDVTERAGVAGRGYSMAMAVGDYDNDGYEDLYVAGVNENVLYHNNGDGTFTDVTARAKVTGRTADGRKLWGISAAWLDYDNDGRLDLFVSNYCDWSPGQDPVCGGLAASERGYCPPDMYRGEPPQLYRNMGDGTFRDVSRESGVGRVLGKGMGVAIADYDDDGYPDIFVANDNFRNFLFHNLRNGRFEEVGIRAGVAYNGDGREMSGMGTDFQDYDGDGRPDIVMTALSRETYELFRNTGKGSFADTSGPSGIARLGQRWSGWSCGLADLDNDGLRDLFVAAGGLEEDDPQPNRIFRNLGNGTFADASNEAGPPFQVLRQHRGAAFADFDNDGRIDVAVSALNAPLELLMNWGPVHHWLELKLRGTASNRSALGAKVVCTTASRRQVGWVANSVGYACASDLRVHFGLGGDREADLEIRWPSGTVQHLRHVASDQQVEVVEPPRPGKGR